jgi:hypothetical protein
VVEARKGLQAIIARFRVEPVATASLRGLEKRRTDATNPKPLTGKGPQFVVKEPQPPVKQEVFLKKLQAHSPSKNILLGEKITQEISLRDIQARVLLKVLQKFFEAPNRVDQPHFGGLR